MISQLGSGMMTTIQIFLLTLIFSLPLGLLVAFGRMSKNAVIRTITKIYISIMRGTPLMLQLLVVYFGPYYIFGVNISSSYRAYAVVIAFAINYAAYFAEIYRGGIESMPVGQYMKKGMVSHAFSGNIRFIRRNYLPFLNASMLMSSPPRRRDSSAASAMKWLSRECSSVVVRSVASVSLMSISRKSFTIPLSPPP